MAGAVPRAFPTEEVQLLFLRCIESLLVNVRQCCSVLGEDVVFDVDGFLAVHEQGDVPFLKALTATQSFSAFVTSTMQEMTTGNC